MELERDFATRVHVRRVELDARGEEALPQLDVRKIEFAVVLAGPRREQAILRVIAVEDGGDSHGWRAEVSCSLKWAAA